MVIFYSRKLRDVIEYGEKLEISSIKIWFKNI